MTTIALPQQQIQMRQLSPQQRMDLNNRKFAEKPNALKKVALDDLDDDIQTNQIDGGNGFSWSNVMGSVLQMIFNGGLMAGPNKSDDIDTAPVGFQQSPWAQIFSVGEFFMGGIDG